MSLYDFCTHISDPDTGAVIIDDYECQVSASVEIRNGLPEYHFDEVIKDGVDLLKSKSTMTKMLAFSIIEQAETASWLHDKINEREGIVCRGLGYNDPNSRFARVS